MGLGPYPEGDKPKVMREFDTGATRDSADGKPDYEGYMSPLVIRRYGQYMLSHQVQSDGKARDSDNWQKGIPAQEYVKSLLRHVMDLWSLWRGYPVYDKAGKAVNIEDVCCAILFNVSGFLHVRLKMNFQRIEVTRFEKGGNF